MKKDNDPYIVLQAENVHTEGKGRLIATVLLAAKTQDMAKFAELAEKLDTASRQNDYGKEASFAIDIRRIVNESIEIWTLSDIPVGMNGFTLIEARSLSKLKRQLAAESVKTIDGWSAYARNGMVVLEAQEEGDNGRFVTAAFSVTALTATTFP